MMPAARPVKLRGPLKLHRHVGLLGLLLLAGLCCASCASQTDTGEDPEVTTRGSAEVTAQLVEIRGEFPDNANYDYAFVMKYEVLQTHRGEVDSDVIYVGHYNPRKPRATVADERAREIGGNLEQFRARDVHRMALELPIDDYFMGGIVDKYFEEKSDPIYWAVWTNRVVE
jgi:hypothetical protein